MDKKATQSPVAKPSETKASSIGSSSKPKEEELVHDMSPKSGPFFSMKVLGIFLVVILLGVGTGYVFAQQSYSGPIKQVTGDVEQGETYGSDNTRIFKDTAEGVLKEGGIEGEGQYHLERPGGPSQSVYLISSTVDMSEFIDKKVKVWGETQAAQHAGWLMDVGRVQVL